MDFKQIQELIKLVNKTNLTEFKMEDDNFKILIRTDKGLDAKKTQQVIQHVQAAPFVAPPAQTAPITAAAPQQQATPQPDLPAKEESKPADEEKDYVYIKSPIVGTFYRSPSPDKPPFLKVGDSVKAGQVVCVVEAMKLFNEIESEVSGKVVKVLVEDASPVEYDQALFLIDPNG